MRTSRWLTGLTAGLLLPLIPGTAAAAAETTTIVTIDSPSAGGTVAGTVDVTFTVLADPAAPPQRATVVLGYRDLADRRPPTEVVREIPPGTCAVTCTLTVPVPTDGWTRVDQGQADPTLYDGLQGLAVEVDDGGTGAQAGHGVLLANARPYLAGSGTATTTDLGLVGTDDQLTVPVRTTAAATDVDRTRRALLFVAGGALDVSPAQRSNGDWTWRGSVAALPPGVHRMRAVVFDERGVASLPRDFRFTIDRGPSARVETELPAVLPADPMLLPPLALTVAPSVVPSQVWVADGEIRLDGRLVGGFRGATRYLPTRTLSWTSVPGAGPRTLTVVVRDNRGLARTVLERTVEVDAGPQVAVRVVGPLVHQGPRPALEVDATATAGTTLRSWTAEVDGVPAGEGSLCSAICPGSARVAPVWPADEQLTLPGEHTVTVSVTDSLGMTTVRSATATSVPTVTVSTPGTPASVPYGTPLVVAATATTSVGAPLAGAPVELQSVPVGSTTWQPVVTGTGGVDGRVRLATPARTNAAWRVVVPGQPGSWVGGASAPTRTTVTATARVVPPTTAVVAGRAATLTVQSSPYEPVAVQVQVRRSGSTTWTTVASPTLTSTATTAGTAVAKVTFGSRGTWYVRAVRPATRLVAAGTSPELTVPVG